MRVIELSTRRAESSSLRCLAPQPTRYSTPLEFKNARNSRQSLFSGIGVTVVAELDKDVQALLGGHRRVGARVGLIGSSKLANTLTDFSTLILIERRVRLPLGGDGPSVPDSDGRSQVAGAAARRRCARRVPTKLTYSRPSPCVEAVPGIGDNHALELPGLRTDSPATCMKR